MPSNHLANESTQKKLKQQRKDRKGIKFWVPGLPKTAGSKTSFTLGNGRTVTKDSCDNKLWRNIVACQAAEVMKDWELLTGPIDLRICFLFLRPKSHFGTGRNAHKLKASAPEYHTKKPDTTKLVRCAEDAMKGIVWADDSQVVCQLPVKVYGQVQGAAIEVVKLTTPPSLLVPDWVKKLHPHNRF